jgi:hypothetical protein
MICSRYHNGGFLKPQSTFHTYHILEEAHKGLKRLYYEGTWGSGKSQKTTGGGVWVGQKNKRTGPVPLPGLPPQHLAIQACLSPHQLGGPGDVRDYGREGLQGSRSSPGSLLIQAGRYRDGWSDGSMEGGKQTSGE